MDVKEIEKIVRAGGSSLAEALHQYWPVSYSEKGDMAERNTTLHLGHELIKAGFGLYAEHPFKMGKDQKFLDLLALNYKEKIEIRIEVKRYSSSKTLNGIYQDLEKIKSFQLTDDLYDYDSIYENKFGIIICTSWDSTFIEWWEDPEADSSKESKAITKKKKEIGKLIKRSLDHSKKGKGDCASGTYPLENSEMKRGDDAENWPIHGMQYLIFDLNSKKITKLLP